MKETGIDEMDKIAWRDLTMEAADLSLSLSLSLSLCTKELK